MPEEKDLSDGSTMSSWHPGHILTTSDACVSITQEHYYGARDGDFLFPLSLCLVNLKSPGDNMSTGVLHCHSFFRLRICNFFCFSGILR